MCSRLVSGSALDADQPEQPGDVALDLVADDLGVAVSAGTCSEPTMLIGTPDCEPGV